VRRAAIIGLASVLTMGVAAGATQAAKVKKVKVETLVVIEGHGVNIVTGESIFHGHVSAERRKCVRQRTVRLELDGGIVASTTTELNGDWQISLDDAAGGDYRATAERRTYKRRRHGEVKRKIVCRAGISDVLSIKD
jgi:hypothetical protein